MTSSWQAQKINSEDILYPTVTIRSTNFLLWFKLSFKQTSGKLNISKKGD